jgi:pimeloyl-ACP methyl ester carboxylesterase
MIAPYMPDKNRLGRPRVTEMRTLVNSIFFIAQSGCQWRLLPKEFPPYTTAVGLARHHDKMVVDLLPGAGGPETTSRSDALARARDYRGLGPEGAACGVAGPHRLLAHALRLAQVRGGVRRMAAIQDFDRRAWHPLHSYPIASHECSADRPHSWVAEYFSPVRDVIGPLTDPTAHGGTAADAFDVIIPSLPGFGFSDKPTERGWNVERTARAWGVLMQRLGYRRYVAQGGDWGAFVTTAMAQHRAPWLAAIHLNFAQTIPDVIPDVLLPDQKRAVEARKVFREKGSAYLQLQSTRPQTIGYALADSPVGQAAWIYDIFNIGTGNLGHPEDALSRDQMLDEITLFWLTDTAASSARIYLEQAQLMGKRNNPGRIELPVGVSVFPNDMPPARSWAPLVYPQLFYWHELDRGGHFAQLEVPQLFTEELRLCFRSFRSA